MAKVNISLLLEELKDFYFKEGQTFEVLRAIYPHEPKINVVKYKKKYFTKPLGVDKKFKKNLIKEGDDLADFFKEKTKGDFIRVLSILDNGKKAVCENLSMHKEIKEEFYKDNFVLESVYLRDGSLKLCKRSVSKYLVEKIKEEPKEKI